MNRILALTLIAASWLLASEVHAGVGAEFIKQFGKLFGRETGQEAVEAGGKTVTKKLAHELAEETGVRAAKQIGSREVLGLSDDAAKVVIAQGDDVLQGLGSLSAQSSRRLSMMAQEIEATGHAPEVYAAIAKGGVGDQVIDWLWRSKGTLVGGAAITALLLNPEAALAAGGEIANTLISETAEHVAEPLVTGITQHGALGIVGGSWLLLLGAFLCLLLARYLKQRHPIIYAPMARIALIATTWGAGKFKGAFARMRGAVAKRHSKEA